MNGFEVLSRFIGLSLQSTVSRWLFLLLLRSDGAMVRSVESQTDLQNCGFFLFALARFVLGHFILTYFVLALLYIYMYDI